MSPELPGPVPAPRGHLLGNQEQGCTEGTPSTLLPPGASSQLRGPAAEPVDSLTGPAGAPQRQASLVGLLVTLSTQNKTGERAVPKGTVWACREDGMPSAQPRLPFCPSSGAFTL